MVNWSAGLQQLGKGLGTYAQHQIYKDEQARKDRLAAAEQRYRDRMIALQEQRHASNVEFQENRLDLQREEVDIRSSQVEGINALREQQTKLAEIQGEILQREQEGGGYDQDKEELYLDWQKHLYEMQSDITDRADEIRNNTMLSDEEKQAAMQEISAQKQQIDRMDLRVGLTLGKYSPEQVEDMMAGEGGEEGGPGVGSIPPAGEEREFSGGGGNQGGGPAQIPAPMSGLEQAGSKTQGFLDIAGAAMNPIKTLAGAAQGSLKGHEDKAANILSSGVEFLAGAGGGGDQREQLVKAVTEIMAKDGEDAARQALAQKGYGEQQIEQIIAEVAQ